MSSSYVFIVDTDSYAGNFERDMCAYMTGHIGDCEVGDGEAKIYAEETGDPEGEKNFASVCNLPDDSGCHRPAQIERSPNNKEYNSVGINFESPPSKKQVVILKSRAEAFRKYYAGHEFGSKIKILGFRLKTVITNESITEI